MFNSSIPLFIGRFLLLASLLLLITLSGCQERVLHDLDELRANRITVILGRVGIEATKVREGSLWSVAVDSKNAASALRAIEESRAMKPPPPELAASSGGLIQTQEERNRLFEGAVAAALEQTLERLPGVFEARVHLNSSNPSRVSLSMDVQEGSASVLVVSADPASVNEAQVKKLVAGASGIKETEVAVVAVRAQAAWMDSDSKKSIPGQGISYLPDSEALGQKAEALMLKLSDMASSLLRNATIPARSYLPRWFWCLAILVLGTLTLCVRQRRKSGKMSAGRRASISGTKILIPPKWQKFPGGTESRRRKAVSMEADSVVSTQEIVAAMSANYSRLCHLQAPLISLRTQLLIADYLRDLGALLSEEIKEEVVFNLKQGSMELKEISEPAMQIRLRVFQNNLILLLPFKFVRQVLKRRMQIKKVCKPCLSEEEELNEFGMLLLEQIGTGSFFRNQRLALCAIEICHNNGENSFSWDNLEVRLRNEGFSSLSFEAALKSYRAQCLVFLDTGLCRRVSLHAQTQWYTGQMPKRLDICRLKCRLLLSYQVPSIYQLLELKAGDLIDLEKDKYLGQSSFSCEINAVPRNREDNEAKRYRCGICVLPGAKNGKLLLQLSF